MPQDARVERIAEGFDWSEGPVWDRSRKVLLFSDVPMNTVFQWQEGKGVSVFLKPSGYTGSVPRGGEPGSNGLNMDREGRLVLCQHGDRRVARLEADKTFKTLADKYDGKRFNSPNDSVYKTNGDLYFTDPPYGLLKLNSDPAKELDWNGVYRISAADGTVTLLTKEMTFPNGIALSPDEKTLYVANSDPRKAIWMAFPVKEDGTIGAGKLFADVTSSVSPAKKGLPDGMKVDAAGNVFATGPGGVLVFAPTGLIWEHSRPERPLPTAASARTGQPCSSPPTCTSDACGFRRRGRGSKRSTGTGSHTTTRRNQSPAVTGFAPIRA